MTSLLFYNALPAYFLEAVSAFAVFWCKSLNTLVLASSVSSLDCLEFGSWRLSSLHKKSFNLLLPIIWEAFMMPCLGRDRKLLGTSKQSLIQGIALLGHKFCVFKQSLCSLTAYPPSFVKWPCSLLTSIPRRHRGTFSKAVCSNQTCHSPVFFCEMIWTDGFFSLVTWKDENVSGGQNINRDIPAAHWTESLFLEALGESCLLTLNSGMLVVWWVGERRRMEVFPPCHYGLFTLFWEFSWAKESQPGVGRADGPCQQLM